MHPQLPLGIRLPVTASFEDYYAGPNGPAVETLRASAAGTGEAVVFLWGPRGVGKTHLLQAACRLGAASQAVAYVPLGDTTAGLTPAMLEGLEALGLVCIDEVDAVAGDRTWEQALFRVAEGLKASGGRLVASACTPPGQVVMELPDLQSRLAAGPVFALREPDDNGKLQALQIRARSRGLELPADTARYLLRRARRDMGSLFALLNRLDEASLAAKRRLTIPFVRQVLEGTPRP